MSYYDLPTSLEINGAEYEIRSDYRAVLDIMAALSDKEIDDFDRAEAVFTIFYPGFEDMPQSDYEEATRQCFWFIRGGEEEPKRPSPKLVSWEQDFRYIVSPVNKVIGRDIRSMDYLHWWTFLAAYMEIGDCLFSQIVNIRNKQAIGRPLDKSEREFYKKNRDIVDIKRSYTEAEDEFFKKFGGGDQQ